MSLLYEVFNTLTGKKQYSSTGAPPAYVQETPSGVIDGINKDFGLSQAPISNSLIVWIDGVHTSDYTIDSQTITFTTAPSVGQDIYTFYTR